jgi:hypothetical protein
MISTARQTEQVDNALEAARARGRTGGRKPKLTARQVTVAQQMYDEKGADGKRRHTVAEIAETFTSPARPSTATSNPAHPGSNVITGRMTRGNTSSYFPAPSSTTVPAP